MPAISERKMLQLGERPEYLAFELLILNSPQKADFGDWLKKAVAWILRLRSKLLKGPIATGSLTVDEIQQAEVAIISTVQRECFATEYLYHLLKSGTPGEIYPLTKKRIVKEIELITPVSGCFEGKLSQERVGQATLELKIDVDQVKEHSPVLNVVSGSILKTRGGFLSIGREKGLYFRSVQQTLRFNKIEDDREVICDVVATRSDGDRYQRTLHIHLRKDQKKPDWHGSCKIEIGDECVTFECARQSSHFRRLAVDIDYVDQVVWPTITLADFYDVPHKIKERKLDPRAVFEDAGVELIYDPRESDKISDPTPHTPWSKNDMYELMLENLDRHEGDLDTIWCMMANKPPDHHYMGFSFDKKGHHGFGLFMNHKSFTGLHDPDHENHNYAKRKFLHYFIHECGHALGLQHPFDLGKPHELSWMNYAWKYDALNGPGKFYNRFLYSFSAKELEIVRHSPSKAYMLRKAASVSVFAYGIVKSLPSDYQIEEAEEEAEAEKTEINLSLRINVRKEPFHVKELVELEVRIKNKGSTPTVVEKDLNIDQGNLHMYITYPDGKIKDSKAFARPISGTAFSKPMLLYPKEEGVDRHTQLITIGEGDYGADFDVSGKYYLQAVYACGEASVISNKVELKVIETTTKIQEIDNAAFVLGGISHSHFRTVEKTWKKMIGLEIKQKKLLTSKIVSIVDEILLKTVRISTGSKSRAKHIKSKVPAITLKDFLNGTEDLLAHYHSEGEKEDNMFYQQLVIARVKVHLHVNKEKASFEFSQMVADLIARGVKYPAIKCIMKDFEELKITGVEVEKGAAYYQKRVEDILYWFPGKMLEKKEDLSGVGLGVLLSEFDHHHVHATSKIVALLFNKLDETNDLDDVFDYADNLQRSYLVNHHVLHWAMEIFIIHCPIAKKSGILYPLPKDRDQSFDTSAAMTGAERTGLPRESWMDYWRSDGNLHFHHRHWHSVYIGGEISRIVRPNRSGRVRERPELERQGELFAYMHQQMLARYDAERRSWGLDSVQEWRLDDRDTLGYNAGFEYHNHPSNLEVYPRPPQSWPVDTQRMFRDWEENYRTAVDDGVLPEIFVAGRKEPFRIRMDFNLSGHVLEASSFTWGNTIGSMHNRGHGVFGAQLVPAGRSYMTSPVSAMRDPIFYRWHKRIDNLWQYWNKTQVTELAKDSPSIVIRSSDIIMRKTNDPLNEFASFKSDYLTSDEMTTFLGPPIKRFERDNKISHDPFYYHVRFRRTAPGNLNLTFRIFICPLRDVNNRKMWIEMDKFVFKLPANQDSGVIIRPDRHSSVIRRIPSEMEGNVEADTTNAVDGYCECGWPYNMLLPRGTAEGEAWRLCVFVSDNNSDNIEVRSSCGSLSFCGAKGQQYPDKRPMGYPFTTDLTINEKETTIPDAINALSNAAISSFVIKNNVVAASTSSVVEVWSAWSQLNPDYNPQSADVISYSPSRIVGRLRVLVDDGILTLNRSRRISIRFQGRGTGNGQYIVNNAAVTLRRETSLNIRRETDVSVITVGGQTKFDVPEDGLVTDEIEISRQAQDLFVTFTLESPGCLLRGAWGGSTNTWIIRNPTGEAATSHDWDNLPNVQGSPSIYCVSAVMAPIPRDEN